MKYGKLMWQNQMNSKLEITQIMCVFQSVLVYMYNKCIPKMRIQFSPSDAAFNVILVVERNHSFTHWMAVEKMRAASHWNGDLFPLTTFISSFFFQIRRTNTQNHTISIKNISDNLWKFILLILHVRMLCVASSFCRQFRWLALGISLLQFKQPKNLW